MRSTFSPRHGVLGAELAQRLGATAQLRDRIAHGYAPVDAARLWEELPSGIATFDEFAVAIARLIAP